MWKDFLIKRGLNEETIKEYRISYVHPWIRIPYTKEENGIVKGRWFGNGENRPLNIPKYLWLRGKPEVPFNWRPLQWDTFVYICEGELDTMLLMSAMKKKDNIIGLPYGASTFKKEWAEALRRSKVKVFSLLDNDKAGELGAQNIANKIQRDIQHISWPSNNIGYDITDFAEGSSIELADRIGRLSFKTIKTVNEDLVVYKSKTFSLGKNDDDLETLKKKIPIEAVISNFTKMKSIPLGFQAHCPFHEDKVASLVIYKKTNTFYCFSCGVGGTSLDFLMKMNGVGLSKAADFLRENYVKRK